MNNFNKLVFSVVTLFTLDLGVQPVYSIRGRDIVTVSNKRHIKAEHVVGLDTYNNPVNYYRREEYILIFKEMNGYFNINKELFKDSWIGREFTVENNRLFFCRPKIDGCNSFK